jgi:hypothetical protein
VDDDEAILRSLEGGLLDEPYNKLFTSSCKEALEILKREEVSSLLKSSKKSIHASSGWYSRDIAGILLFRWQSIRAKFTY